MTEHELGFLTFVAESQRRRLRTLLELGPKRRADVRALFHHAIKLDPKCAHALAGGKQTGSNILYILRQKGAPENAYVMSSNSLLDRCEMPLAEALDGIVGSGDGAFISCIAGKLGYFEGEDMNSGHLLSR